MRSRYGSAVEIFVRVDHVVVRESTGWINVFLLCSHSSRRCAGFCARINFYILNVRLTMVSVPSLLYSITQQEELPSRLKKWKVRCMYSASAPIFTFCLIEVVIDCMSCISCTIVSGTGKDA